MTVITNGTVIGITHFKEGDSLIHVENEKETTVIACKGRPVIRLKDAISWNGRKIHLRSGDYERLELPPVRNS